MNENIDGIILKKREKSIIDSVTNFINKYLEDPFQNDVRMKKFLSKWVVNYYSLEYDNFVVLFPDSYRFQNIFLDCPETQESLGKIVASGIPQNLIFLQIYLEYDLDYKARLQDSLIEIKNGIELISKKNKISHLNGIITMFYNALESYFKHRDNYNHYLEALEEIKKMQNEEVGSK